MRSCALDACTDQDRLDVQQHMSLCRHYVRSLRRSVLLETPEMEKSATSNRASTLLEQFNLDDAGPSDGQDEKSRNQHLSAFLRSDLISNGGAQTHSPHGSLGSQPSVPQSGDRGSRGERPPRASFMSTGLGDTTDSGSPAQHTVERNDLSTSAQKILYTFLLPGSEREIILPTGIMNDICVSIEEDHRDDPEVFDAAKDYTFQAMERDAFPGFLRAKALGNLVPPSMFVRLILGLVALFGGFWAGFACIFLDLPKHTRCWVSRHSTSSCTYTDIHSQLILPFTIGIYCLSSQQYSIDPVLALLGFSEYTFMNWARIREPFVRKLLNRRATMVLTWTILIGVAVIVLFIFVPGKRL